MNSARYNLSERSLGNRAKNIASLTSLCLALTACAVTTDASQPATMGRCGGFAAYSKEGNRQPVHNPQTLVAQVKHDVMLLYRRSMRNAGEIDLPDMANDFDNNYVITAQTDELAVGYPSNAFLQGGDDRIVFPFRNGEPTRIALGAVSCIGDNGQLYPRNIATTLPQLVTQTNVLAIP